MRLERAISSLFLVGSPIMIYGATIQEIDIFKAYWIERRNQQMRNQWSSLWRSYLLCFLVYAVVPTPCAHGTDAPQHLEPFLSKNTRLMVFSPHPDDESLAAAGLIQRVLSLGGSVKVVFMTSGDGFPKGSKRKPG